MLRSFLVTQKLENVLKGDYLFPSWDNKSLNDKDFTYTRSVGNRKYLCATRSGQVGFGVVYNDIFEEKKSYVFNATSVFHMSKVVTAAIGEINKLKEFALQLGAGRSRKEHGYYLKGSWFEGETSKRMRDERERRGKASFFITERYRVDFRSRYQDEQGEWTWGRGVSFYLDEFQKLVWSLPEAVKFAVFDHEKKTPDLIKIAAEEIFRRATSLSNSVAGVGVGGSRPKLQACNLGAGTSRLAGEANYIKEMADSLLKNESDLRNVLLRAASDSRLVSVWLNEVKYLRASILACAGAFAASHKYTAGAEGAVDREYDMIADGRPGPVEDEEEEEEQRTELTTTVVVSGGGGGGGGGGLLIDEVGTPPSSVRRGVKRRFADVEDGGVGGGSGSGHSVSGASSGGANPADFASGSNDYRV
jgi:hypothetical protein